MLKKLIMILLSMIITVIVINSCSLDSSTEPVVFAPTCQITSPENNQEFTVGTKVPITVSPTHVENIDSVNFYIDDVLEYAGIDTPFTYVWDTSCIDTVEHSITVEVIDNHGNKRSDEVIVVAKNYIVFRDLILETRVREVINKPTGYIFPSDVDKINTFSARGLGIEDISGLEFFESMETLNLSYSKDVNGCYVYNNISDITPISNLTNLRNLFLSSNHILDISPISKLTKLNNLELEDNNIEDITALADLLSLSTLNLNYNNIHSIQSLSYLKRLSILTINNNIVYDIQPLVDLKNNLMILELRHNRIHDLSPASELINLIYLDLSHNWAAIKATISDLQKLTYLNLTETCLSGISFLFLREMNNLTVLALRGNQIGDLSSLTKLKNLKYLYLTDNEVSNIGPLSNLNNLKAIYLENNWISDIAPLVENSGLDEHDCLHLTGNPLDDTSKDTYIPQLRERGVAIWFVE